MYTVLLDQDQVQVGCGWDGIENKCLSNLGRKSLPMIGYLEHIERRRKTTLILIFLDCLTLEDGTNRLSRNVGNKLLFYTVCKILEGRRFHLHLDGSLKSSICETNLVTTGKSKITALTEK
jgi:hypothetical protein